MKVIKKKVIKKVEIHYEEHSDIFKVCVHVRSLYFDYYVNSFRTIDEATKYIREKLNFYEEEEWDIEKPKKRRKRS